MATLLMFPPKVHFDDDNGEPLVGGKVFTYEPGTTTPKDTYADKAQVATNTNPVILDARGEAEIWLDGEYKIVIKDSSDVEIYTVDNASTEGADSALSEWLVTGDNPTYISATQFSVPADLTATYHVGRRVKLTVTAGIVYGVISATAYTTLTTVTVVLDSGAIDSGLSVSDVGLLSANNQSYPINQIQYGGYAYVADTGAADVYVAVMVPPVPSYSTGFTCKVLMANANATTTPTINVNGLGAKTIKLPTGSALRVGDIPANFIAELTYDGTDFILINQYQVPDHAHAGSGSGGIIGYPLYSDGIDGAYSSGATGNIDGDEKNYTTYIVNDTHVMTVNTGRGVIIIADVSITIAGTIDASGLGAGGATVAASNGGSTSFAVLSGSGSASGGGGGSDSVSTLGGTGGSSTCKMRTVTGGVSNAGTTADNGITHPITNNMGPEPRVGSGGGAGGSGSGNEGGAGGGFIILIAPIVIIEATATLDVSGVDGNAGGAGGSGGGGAGGSITIISHNYTDNGGTFTLAGGTGGVASGGGRAGGDGGTGIKRVVEL